MTWRFQEAILRFLPNAEESLETTYKIVAENEDWVAVNMVGREDDDKGHPLRFLETLRKLRQQYHGVKLSIHAGEVDEPNFHIRDTLLLGADRIGHGVNLIKDPQTLREMRHGPYLVEVNLISNLLLEYVDDYSQHPFPEYLRIGVPVALSTDDRGMWDSTMTDEFYVAVREFNLSWTEIKLLSRNSISFAFLPEDVKNELLTTNMVMLLLNKVVTVEAVAKVVVLVKTSAIYSVIFLVVAVVVVDANVSNVVVIYVTT
jgi:adenosine deaminase CECR1